jgi:hypothetical protein
VAHIAERAVIVRIDADPVVGSAQAQFVGDQVGDGAVFEDNMDQAKSSVSL